MELFLKLKLDAERHLDIVRIVREEQPAARLLVDANQSWSRPLLVQLLPKLQALGVELIEQRIELAPCGFALLAKLAALERRGGHNSPRCLMVR